MINFKRTFSPCTFSPSNGYLDFQKDEMDNYFQLNFDLIMVLIFFQDG